MLTDILKLIQDAIVGLINLVIQIVSRVGTFLTDVVSDIFKFLGGIF